MRIEYVALRNLASGHSTDESYEIVVFASVIEPEFDFRQTRQTSLDQSRVEVEVLGSYQTLDINTDYIPVGTDTDEFEEFLHSVMHGESFTLDPDSDTAETAVNPLTVMMESTRYRRDRSLPGHYAYSFSVRTI